MIEQVLDRIAARAPRPVLALVAVVVAVGLVAEWLLYVAGYAARVAWDEARS